MLFGWLLFVFFLRLRSVWGFWAIFRCSPFFVRCLKGHFFGRFFVIAFFSSGVSKGRFFGPAWTHFSVGCFFAFTVFSPLLARCGFSTFFASHLQGHKIPSWYVYLIFVDCYICYWHDLFYFLRKKVSNLFCRCSSVCPLAIVGSRRQFSWDCYLQLFVTFLRLVRKF